MKTLVYDQNISCRKEKEYLLRDVSRGDEYNSSISFVGSGIVYSGGYSTSFNPPNYTYPAVYISNIKFPYGTGREDDPYRMVE